MNLQKCKKGFSYILLVVLCSNMAIPGYAILADTPTTAENISGGAVVTSEATPIPETKEKNKKKRKDKWKVKLKRVSRPLKLNRGAGFDVEGTLVSARKLKNVKAEIENQKGKVLYHKSVKIKGKNRKNFDLNKVDGALKFSELKKGNYKYQISVKDEKDHSQVVLSCDFKVQQPKWMAPIENPRWGDGWHCRCSTHRGKHYGWDIKGGGHNIHAVSDGTVVYAKYHSANGLGSFGKLIVIHHGDGIYSYYAHCKKIKTKVGERVRVGDVIGVTGSTGMAFGPHLHFELRKGPEFKGGYNGYKLIDKYTYRQFNPSKKIKRK